jgi:hypothetical protein
LCNAWYYFVYLVLFTAAKNMYIEEPGPTGKPLHPPPSYESDLSEGITTSLAESVQKNQQNVIKLAKNGERRVILHVGMFLNTVILCGHKG